MSKEKESYEDQINRQIRKAKKEKNAEASVYYIEALHHSAVVAFESFKGAWCYDGWRKRHQEGITKQEHEFKRFAHL